MSEWNPADPAAISVYYDLTAWTHEQRAEVAAELAEAEIPHAWEGEELVVPEELEAEVDAMFEVLEARLGIDTGSEAAGAGGDQLPPVEPFDDSAPTTEYELGDWSPLEREAVANALRIAHIPHRWDGDTLLVPTDAEDPVDDLLDEVERLDVATLTSERERRSRAAPSYELVSELFLASTRLQRQPLDEQGLDQLQTVLANADPEVPPPGVAARLWRDACALADHIRRRVEDAGDFDADDVRATAKQLRELLAPLV